MKSNKPNYLTRPSKHVERRIFVETLQCLNKINYDISKYHYIGFGCYYYVDFILFNKLLAINKMTCLEKEVDIEKRMNFNKPYKFIDLQIDDFSNFISNLRNDKKYFIWLDYEGRLDEDIISDIRSVVNTLEVGSIFIITVNVDLKELQYVDGLSEESLKKYKKEQFENLMNKYGEHSWAQYCKITKGHITSAKFPEFFSEVLQAAIFDVFKGRLEESFCQLFNYVYQDGVRMLTFGGIIEKKENCKNIKNVLKNLNYINYKTKPMGITIPSLTLREKLFLDRKIQKNKKISHNIPFELKDKEIEDYIKYSKHYPTFYEVFID